MDTSKTTFTPICAWRMGVAVGVVWGLCMLALGIATVYTDSYGRELVNLMSSIYIGYTPGSWGGALSGLVWGLVDGFIGTAIIVGLYNLLALRGKCRFLPKEAGGQADAPAAPES